MLAAGLVPVPLPALVYNKKMGELIPGELTPNPIFIWFGDIYDPQILYTYRAW